VNGRQKRKLNKIGQKKSRSKKKRRFGQPKRSASIPGTEKRGEERAISLRSLKGVPQKHTLKKEKKREKKN